MYSRTYGASIQGIEGRIIQIEADISDGLPGFSLVGYLSSEAKEARERVRIALKNSGYRFPPRKVTINLSPADIRKDGTGYDLAIAVAILAAYGYIPEECINEILFIGELSLDGAVKPVSGVLPMVYKGWEQRMKYCFVPKGNQKEASVVDGIGIIGVSDLKQVVDILLGKDLDSFVCKRNPIINKKQGKLPDFQDVRGQELVQRAAQVAVSGMHNMLIIGPPGTGKSMIAQRIAGIMPSMNFEEQMEISRIYSVAGLLTEDMPLMTARPFRAPHHTITQTALVGGGKYPRPGELSLASGGVLFLDELPEFDRNSIEVLRQPLEDGWVTISRLNGNCRYPAKCLLLAAMNPCKCGWYPDRKRCQCTPQQVKKYLGKISRPLLDRIDVCTETVPLNYQELEGEKKMPQESSREICKRIERVHQIQWERYQKENFLYNSQLPPQKLKKYCIMSSEAKKYLEAIFQKMEFSARAYHKILKVGRSIADLEGSHRIEKQHIAEAVCYRILDRKYWGTGGEE